MERQDESSVNSTHTEAGFEPPTLEVSSYNATYWATARIYARLILKQKVHGFKLNDPTLGV